LVLAPGAKMVAVAPVMAALKKVMPPMPTPVIFAPRVMVSVCAPMDSDPKEFQRVLEQTAKRDLGWFFDDWVYRDRGLPDLSIASVTPRAIDQIGNKGSGWLVAVEVRNDGGAVAEVPVTVRSGTLTSTQRLRIPARSSASTRIVFEGIPSEVLVNDGTVPEVAASIHTRQIITH